MNVFFSFNDFLQKLWLTLTCLSFYYSTQYHWRTRNDMSNMQNVKSYFFASSIDDFVVQNLSATGS